MDHKVGKVFANHPQALPELERIAREKSKPSCSTCSLWEQTTLGGIGRCGYLSNDHMDVQTEPTFGCVEHEVKG
jgi:hypothetical protein